MPGTVLSVLMWVPSSARSLGQRDWLSVLLTRKQAQSDSVTCPRLPSQQVEREGRAGWPCSLCLPGTGPREEALDGRARLRQLQTPRSSSVNSAPPLMA